MLYNPEWKSPKTESKNIMSVESLIDWLERKPSDGTYKYTDGKNCLLCQYFSDMGMEIESVDSGSYYLKSPNKNDVIGIGIRYPCILDKIAYCNPYYEEYRTFGVALLRAREYLA